MDRIYTSGLWEIVTEDASKVSIFKDASKLDASKLSRGCFEIDIDDGVVVMVYVSQSDFV